MDTRSPKSSCQRDYVPPGVLLETGHPLPLLGYGGSRCSSACGSVTPISAFVFISPPRCPLFCVSHKDMHYLILGATCITQEDLLLAKSLTTSVKAFFSHLRSHLPVPEMRFWPYLFGSTIQPATLLNPSDQG